MPDKADVKRGCGPKGPICQKGPIYQPFRVLRSRHSGIDLPGDGAGSPCFAVLERFANTGNGSVQGVRPIQRSVLNREKCDGEA
jgi:hypothetical protein